MPWACRRTLMMVFLCLLLSAASLWQWPRSCGGKFRLQLRQRDETQYVPEELQALLVVVTAYWNVAKMSHLELMLHTMQQYQSPVLDVVLITNNEPAMRAAMEKLQVPLNITVYEGKQPQDDTDSYWLTWLHRDYIKEVAVTQRNYTTVLYLEDDTRVTWPALVSWAIDTRSLAPYNFTRCFFRVEVDPATGASRLMDYRHGWNLSEPISKLVQFDLAADAPQHWAQVTAQLQGRFCGFFPNGTGWPCSPHRYLVAPTSNPFQGFWVATWPQLQRFMSTPLWTKAGALSFNTAAYVPAPDNGWGPPERSASIGILGGYVPVPEGRVSAPSSCMVPFVRAGPGLKPQLSELGAVDHLRNAYSQWGNIMLSEAFA